jgi:hypothetical protein
MRRPGAWVGLLGFVILVYILINTLRTETQEAPQSGGSLPAFATPLVLSELEGDANVASKADQGEAGKVPACSVRGADDLNSCELDADRPAVLGFLVTRGGDCSPSFDALQRVAKAHPEVGVAGVIVRGDRDDARKLVREHHWTFPIGFDQDGAVANIYGIAVCPETVLAYPGGKVRATLVGTGDAARDLDKHVRELVAAAKRRGWKPR